LLSRGAVAKWSRSARLHRPGRRGRRSPRRGRRHRQGGALRRRDLYRRHHGGGLRSGGADSGAGAPLRARAPGDRTVGPGRAAVRGGHDRARRARLDPCTPEHPWQGVRFIANQQGQHGRSALGEGSDCPKTLQVLYVGGRGRVSGAIVRRRPAVPNP